MLAQSRNFLPGAAMKIGKYNYSSSQPWKLLSNMKLQTLSQLNPSKIQAVIINVGTKKVTTLAFLSALKYTDLPVLIIDCESTDGSLEYFEKLMLTYRFDLLSAPLKQHGVTLDWLFQNINSEAVLLIDSDAEILSPDILPLMKRFIDHPLVFGCGFLHGPCWLVQHPDVGYYQERMWIPLTMLKVSSVRQAISKGYSFRAETIFNDLAFSRKISRYTLGLRFRFSLSRNWKFSWLNFLKGTYHGLKPSYVFYDTGAQIFEHLKYGEGLKYVGFPTEIQDNYVNHYHGITRAILTPDDPHATSVATIYDQVEERLKSIYNFEVHE
jgi:glycosyltransferase involved in cell wall biosynthesis